jgi:hypothetical protein
VLVEDFGGVADEFAAGEGVELTAEGVDFAGDVFGAATGGAFEEHVFDEVADAVFGGFSAREPQPIQMPAATLRTEGMGSVMTRMPLDKVVTAMSREVEGCSMDSLSV